MSTATAPLLQITEDQKRLYQEEGYMVLERALSADYLALLRGECQFFMDKLDREMDAKGTDVIGINHRNKRYFVANCFRDQPKLRTFLFSELMAEVCRATLGPNAFLFWEQYVVKGAEQGMKFSWHQDSGYVGHDRHEPYLTCWIALDDMSEENGTVHLLPFSYLGIRTRVKHIQEPGSNDLVGYFGKQPGIAMIVPAGTIVCFTSVNFHCSGFNRSPKLRRAYLAQYSAEPIMTEDGTKSWGSVEPFLKGGQIIGH